MANQTYIFRYRDLGETHSVNVSARNISHAETLVQNYMQRHYIFHGFIVTPFGHHIPISR